MPDFSAPPPGWAGPPGSGPGQGLGPGMVPGPQGQTMMGPRMQQLPPRMPPHGMGQPQLQGQAGGPPQFSSNFQFPPPGVQPPVGGGPGMQHPGDRQHHGSMPPNQFGFQMPFGRPGGSQMGPQIMQQQPNNPNMGGPQWEKPT